MIILRDNKFLDQAIELAKVINSEYENMYDVKDDMPGSFATVEKQKQATDHHLSNLFLKELAETPESYKLYLAAQVVVDKWLSVARDTSERTTRRIIACQSVQGIFHSGDFDDPYWNWRVANKRSFSDEYDEAIKILRELKWIAPVDEPDAK